MVKPILLVALMLPAAALAQSRDPGSLDPNFGAAVAHNIRVQTVDMNPTYEGKLVEGGTGATSAAAARRFMTDKVKQPSRPSGATGGQGGDSSSGSDK